MDVDKAWRVQTCTVGVWGRQGRSLCVKWAVKTNVICMLSPSSPEVGRLVPLMKTYENPQQYRFILIIVDNLVRGSMNQIQHMRRDYHGAIGWTWRRFLIRTKTISAQFLIVRRFGRVNVPPILCKKTFLVLQAAVSGGCIGQTRALIREKVIAFSVIIALNTGAADFWRFGCYYFMKIVKELPFCRASSLKIASGMQNGTECICKGNYGADFHKESQIKIRHHFSVH